MIGAGDLVRGLVPVHAGVAFPERRERRLVGRARRSGSTPQRLDRVEILRIRGGQQAARRRWLELQLIDEDERKRVGQPLRAHRAASGRGAPAAGSAATGQSRIHR